MRLFLHGLLFALTCCFGGKVLGQTKTYTQKHLYQHQVYPNTYNFWRHPDRWLPKGDTLVYFVDDRTYKGFVNYGIEVKSKDNKPTVYVEDFAMGYLQVQVTRFEYNSARKTVDIEGTVTDSWPTGNKKSVAIFLGKKKDTTTVLYNNIKLVSPQDRLVTLHGVPAGFDTKLDSFPSFYMTDYTKFQTEAGAVRPFKVHGKIDKDSFLSFGLENCYAWIFDLGKMIFTDTKGQNPKKIKTKTNPAFHPIIEKNRQVSRRTAVNTATDHYYTLTQKAESYFISRQYAKATAIYALLDKSYPVLYARDLHNAIRTAILARDLKSAFSWSLKLAAKSIPFTYFNAPLFDALKKNQAWPQFSASYAALYQSAQTKLNHTLRQNLAQLTDEDQAAYGLSDRKEPQILYQTTQTVTDKLITLLQKEGFPSEEKTGITTKNDTALVFVPDYYVLIRHAVQQKPKNLPMLQGLLDRASNQLEYDAQRSPNHRNFPDACFHVYKGKLYQSKSCGTNELMVKKMAFMFHNPQGFIVDLGDYIITEYDPENPEEYDQYYNNNYTLVLKLTDDWTFYKK